MTLSMSNIRYDTITVSNSADNLTLLFLSVGKESIVKAIEYTYIQNFNGLKIFNLGFGNFDFETGGIDDFSNSNNDDVYKVFNTVLNSVPKFFKTHKNKILMIEGSDSTAEFAKKCKLTCKKQCRDVQSCKNKNRRINLYRAYLNKNYSDLIVEYGFLGGTNIAGQLQLENYVQWKNYEAIFVYKK
jgi:hypothetical protein